MRVALTATQQGINGRQWTTLYDVLRQLKPALFIHGACLGGDDQGDSMAADLGIPRIAFPSTIGKKRVPDDELKRRTGSLIMIMPAEQPLIRNIKMLKCAKVIEGSKLIACPRQRHEIIRSGTWTTVRHGRRILGTQNVIIISPEG